MVFLKNIFRFHKKRIFLFFVATNFFFIILFHMSDLQDLVTAQVTAATNNSIYLQFDGLALTMLPQPAIKMTNAIVESASFPELQVDSVSVAPSLLKIHKLIQQQPRGRTYVENLFGGELDAAVSGSSKIKSDNALSLDLEFENFDLKKLFRTLKQQVNLPFIASGTGQLEALIDIDQRMEVQPDGNFDLKIKQARIPAFSLALGPMGALPLPGLDLDNVIIKGQIKNGKLILHEVVLGSSKNELFAKISGDLDLQISPQKRTRLGMYNVSVDLSLSKALQSQFGIIDGFIGSYKRKTLKGSRYTFRATGRANGRDQPRFSNL